MFIFCMRVVLCDLPCSIMLPLTEHLAERPVHLIYSWKSLLVSVDTTSYADGIIQDLIDLDCGRSACESGGRRRLVQSILAEQTTHQ